MLVVAWTIIKDFAVGRALSMQWIDLVDAYEIRAFDDVFSMACNVPKNTAECTDFETNFKASGNKRIGFQTEDENAQLVRLKYAPIGWHYQAHCLEVTTSTVGGLYSKKHDGTDTGFSTLKFYRADGTEITSGLQADLDLDCVKTRIVWQANHSFEIISGQIRNLIDPLDNDVRLDVVVAPHIPYAYGGTKVFIQKLNLKYIREKTELKTDGRASKTITYDPVNFSHRFHFDLTHAAGSKTSHMIALEFYKL